MAQDGLEQDVLLIDQDGQEERFIHLLTFLHEGQRYVALSPEAEADSDEAEVVLLKVVNQDGEDTYVSVDNEVMLDELFGVFLELMEEREAGGED